MRTSDEFYRRKKLILMHLDRLEAKVSPLARDFDEYQQLRFIVLEKAKQKKKEQKKDKSGEHTKGETLKSTSASSPRKGLGDVSCFLFSLILSSKSPRERPKYVS